MVAIRPHASAASERAIDGLGDADEETLEAARKARRSIRLDEQMHVVTLHAEMNDPESVA